LFLIFIFWGYFQIDKEDKKPEQALIIKKENKIIIFNNVSISMIKLKGVVDINNKFYCVLQYGESIQKAKIGELLSEEKYQIKNINLTSIVLIKNDKELKIEVQ